jgi:hypothetical protein
MPLVYGEGHEAFRRLLEEIIRKYTDQSILASQLTYVDYLPRSPRDFCDSQFVTVASSVRLKRFYQPESHPFPFQMTNSGLQMTLPVVSTLSSNFAFGVLNCWDVDSEINRSSRVISRIWIPLLRRGPHKLLHFVRLMWPHTFVPVRLIPRHVASQTDELSDLDELAEKVGEGYTQLNPVTDLMNSDSYSNILIRKPYATIISVPEWSPPSAGSPYLTSFPRGTADYRVFGIYPPRSYSAELVDDPKIMPLPLIFPSTANVLTCGNSVEQGDLDESNKLYSAMIVFKKRGSKPSQYVAVSFASLLSNDGKEHTPSCKIVSNWTPAKHKDGSIVVESKAYRMTDVKGNIIVTVQKTPCSNLGINARRDTRYVGLTQVVFDRRRLSLEIENSQVEDSTATNFLMAHVGNELSDIEDIGPIDGNS